MPQPLIISLEAAIAMSNCSRRTWWRRIEKGSASKLPADTRGRAMLVLEDVCPEIALAPNQQEMELMVQADGGNAQAQAEVGAMFALAYQQRKAQDSQPDKRLKTPALYWLELAAEQEQTDAMHWLGILHMGGHGGDNSPHLAMMWISRAAAYGHVIARAQMETLITVPRG